MSRTDPHGPGRHVRGPGDQRGAERAQARRRRGPGRHAEDEDEDTNIVLDAHDDPIAWRRRLRANPTTHAAYRLTVFLVGLLVVLGGLLLVPLPGPGWLIVLGGIALWSTEFERAQSVLSFARRRLHEWNLWVQPKPWWVKGLIGLGTFALVVAFFWGYFTLTGVPTFLPDNIERLMNHVIP